MPSLTPIQPPVECDVDAYGPTPADLAWYEAEHLPQVEAFMAAEQADRDRDLHTDRAWLSDECFAWRARARRECPGRTCYPSLVADLLERITREFVELDVTSIDQLMARRAEVVPADYRRLVHRSPASWATTPLALHLCADAAWYVHLETPAADLAAWVLWEAAVDAQSERCLTVEDWFQAFS